MAIALAELLPHRPPMLWLTALTDCTETSAGATACFQPGDLAVADGAVLETALVECVAQTAAAAMGSRAAGKPSPSAAAGPAGQGMLVAVSGFKIESRPPAGSELRIEIREVKRLGGMLRIAGSIRCEDRLIASGELSVHLEAGAHARSA